MRRTAVLALAACVLMLTGCAGFRTDVISSFPSVVTVTSLTGEGRAMALAQGECSKRKRQAQLHAGAYPDYTYYCVE